MSATLMIVGLATDGPTNTPVEITSSSDLSVLGYNYTEIFSLSATATSQVLDYTPYNGVTNIFNGNINWLFAPYNQGTTYYFGSVGGSGGQVSVTYTPYLGQSDLIYAIRSYNSSVGTWPYAMRIGGAFATLAVSGWTFTAKYAGFKYNYVNITFSGSTLTISGLQNFQPLTYTGTSELIYQQALSDYLLGLSPIRITSYTQTTPRVSGNLSGGTDGSYSDQDVFNVFDLADIPPAVTHIVLLTPITSSIVNSIYNWLNVPGTQPRMVMVAAPSYTPPTSSWINSVTSSIPGRLDMIGCVMGTTTCTLDGLSTTRYAVESASIALAKIGGLNLTNTPVDAADWSPHLSGPDLDVVKAAGFMSITRYIGNDISVYEGVTSGNNNSFLYSTKVAEIAGMGGDYLAQFIGNLYADGPKPQIASGLVEVLSEISFITNIAASVTTLGDSMYVSIQAQLPGEILSISFTINNNQL